MEPVRETKYGKVLGQLRDGVCIFRGIPYGGKTDSRRFLPAKSPSAWNGIKDCRENGPYAVQQGVSITASWDFGQYFSGGHPELFGCYQEKQSENCLVLNILTPSETTDKLPVIVYIHGGGFAAGSGTTVLGGHRFVKEQNVVLVGVNHRLNAFGFLYLGEIDPDYKESGSAGITDLILALKWIQENIAYFGGDPGNVTLIGESGGGIKIATLLCMPESRGLVHKAVMESAFGKPGRYRPKDAAEITEHFLYSLGIRENAVARLNELPAAHIRDAAAALGTFCFEPVADEIHIPFNKNETFPMTDPDVPILIGTAEDEVAAFASEAEHKVQTQEQMIRAIVDGCGPGWMHLHGVSEEKAKQLIRVFRQEDAKNVDNAHLMMKICTMCGPLERFSFEHAMCSSKDNSAPVYRYILAYDAPHRIIPGRYYAWHGAELPLQFRIVLHPESEKLSQKLALSLGNFARSGDPSIPDLRWNPFTNERKETMIIDEKWRMELDPTEKYRRAWGE